LRIFVHRLHIRRNIFILKKIRLNILGISYSQSQSGSYALVLGESSGRRRLPIIIGGYEAQAIAMEIEKIKPARPLTHDLFKRFAETFGISLREVIINKFHDGIFFAKLVCSNGSEQHDIDARTSDAVALAVRYKCPIYTYESILKETGTMMNDEGEAESDAELQEQEEDTLMGEEDSDAVSETDLSELSTSELEDLLKQAIEKEAFEQASLLRDELNKRK
jgi:uncharacterized protein